MKSQELDWYLEDPLFLVIYSGVKPLQAYVDALESKISNEFYDANNEDETNTLVILINDIERIADELEESITEISYKYFGKKNIPRIRKGAEKSGSKEKVESQIDWEWETSRTKKILTDQINNDGDPSLNVLSLLRDHFEDLYNQIIAKHHNKL